MLMSKAGAGVDSGVGCGVGAGVGAVVGFGVGAMVGFGVGAVVGVVRGGSADCSWAGACVVLDGSFSSGTTSNVTRMVDGCSVTLGAGVAGD